MTTVPPCAIRGGATSRARSEMTKEARGGLFNLQGYVAHEGLPLNAASNDVSVPGQTGDELPSCPAIAKQVSECYLGSRERAQFRETSTGSGHTWPIWAKVGEVSTKMWPKLVDAGHMLADVGLPGLAKV